MRKTWRKAEQPGLLFGLENVIYIYFGLNVYLVHVLLNVDINDLIKEMILSSTCGCLIDEKENRANSDNHE